LRIVRYNLDPINFKIFTAETVNFQLFVCVGMVTVKKIAVITFNECYVQLFVTEKLTRRYLLFLVPI
jgi:hypothetical protein